MADPPVRQRRVGRIILVDESGLSLLFRCGDPARPAAGTWWFPPGGAVEPGESAADSARRELREETGLDAQDLGPIVLQRQIEYEFEGVHYSQEEAYFQVRCDHFDISDSGWTENERRVVQEHRWWSVNELRATTDTVYPEGLVAFLDGLEVPFEHIPDEGYPWGARPSASRRCIALARVKSLRRDTRPPSTSCTCRHATSCRWQPRSGRGLRRMRSSPFQRWERRLLSAGPAAAAGAAVAAGPGGCSSGERRSAPGAQRRAQSIWYRDISAFLKLVVKEAEPKAIGDWYSIHGPYWWSKLLLTRTRRAGAHLGLGEELVARAFYQAGLVVPSVTTKLSPGPGCLPSNCARWMRSTSPPPSRSAPIWRAWWSTISS